MKYLIVLVAFVATIQVSAQTSKGSWMIGGSLKVQRDVSRGTYFDFDLGTPISYWSKTGTVGITPTVGYFVVDNLMTALQISHTYTWNINNAPGKSNQFSIGPVIRYYIPIRKLAVFPEVAYLYNHQKYSGMAFGIPGKVKYNGSIVRAGAGLAWFVTPNIGIEGILAYQAADVKESELSDGNVLYYNIGIQFYLPKNNN